MISVLIPAHNEGLVIGRTLRALLDCDHAHQLDVIVICNGCTDDTALIARGFGDAVRVIETETANKANALNIGDAIASAFPRIYLDADVILPCQDVYALAERLQEGDILAVAPSPSYRLETCSRLVKAYYHIRALLPSSGEGIGGSGVYGLSKVGRSRFGKFPDIVADDTYVRIQFLPQERTTLAASTSVVFAPLTVRELLAIRTRAHYGNLELGYYFPEMWGNRGARNESSLISLLQYPLLWFGLFVYCYVNYSARRRARRLYKERCFKWHQDRTSRSVPDQ